MMVIDNHRYMSSELANITQMLEEHFRVALSAIKLVSTAIMEWIEDGKKLGTDDLERITALEEKGNDLKHGVLDVLSKASSLMQREDLFRLIHYNDKLIDGAEISCYHLQSIMKAWVPNGELKDKVSKLGQLILSIATEQREAVRFLSINIEESIKRSNEICRIEKEIDTLWREIVAVVYSLDIPISTILRFRDFINTLEEISNLSEDAAIAIRGLSLTLNT
jgi:uncharacterized protein Yka (UPF0111/DUF47 family)